MVTIVTRFRFLDLVDFDVNLEVRMVHLIGNRYLSMGRKKQPIHAYLCVNHTDRSTQIERVWQNYISQWVY